MNEQTDQPLSLAHRVASGIVERLPEVIITSVVTGFLLLFGMWLGLRDLAVDVGALKKTLAERNVCLEIAECQKITSCESITDTCKHNMTVLGEQIAAHREDAKGWKERIVRLEDNVYNLLSGIKP